MTNYLLSFLKLANRFAGNGDLGLVSRYWTALSRRGCVGQLRNCFLTQELDENINQDFWKFVNNAREGSCVILQRYHEAHSGISGVSVPKLIPYFAPCEHQANLGCETGRPLSFVIDSYQEASTKQVSNLFMHHFCTKGSKTWSLSTPFVQKCRV